MLYLLFVNNVGTRLIKRHVYVYSQAQMDHDIGFRGEEFLREVQHIRTIVPRHIVTTNMIFYGEIFVHLAFIEAVCLCAMKLSYSHIKKSYRRSQVVIL